MRNIVALIIVLLAGIVGSAAPVRIMPMGDSITYGVGVPGGYRTELYRDLTGAGLSFQFVGSGNDNASATLAAVGQTAQDGIPYFTTQNVIDALHGSIDAVPGAPYGNGGNWLSVAPDVIALQIGTNDVSNIGNETPSQTASSLSALIGDLVAAEPNAKIIVASVTPRSDPTFNADNRAYNALIPGVVQSYASEGDHVSFLDMYAVLNPATDISSDGIHPNAGGYDKMGDAWAGAIEAAEVPEPACAALMVLLRMGLRRRV